MLTARIASYLKNNRWVLNLIFISLGSYSVGGAVNAVVAQKVRVLPAASAATPAKSTASRARRTKRVDYSAMAKRNLMALKRENLEPVVEGAASQSEEATEFDETDIRDCSLPISVRATLVADGAPEWSVAMIYNNSERDTDAYTINESSNKIVDDAILVEIRSREIIVRRSDHLERCRADEESKASARASGPKRPGKSASKSKKSRDSSSDDGDKSKGVSKISETEYSIEREEVDRVLGNLSEVATKARIVPSFKNGKPNGFKLFSIKPGSIYSKIGLRNGDVIQSINGYEMNSPDKALEIYQKLKDSTSITVDIQRRGRAMTMNYGIGR